MSSVLCLFVLALTSPALAAPALNCLTAKPMHRDICTRVIDQSKLTFQNGAPTPTSVRRINCWEDLEDGYTHQRCEQVDVELQAKLNAQLAAPKTNLCEASFDADFKPLASTMRAKTNPKRWNQYAGFLTKYGPCLDGSYAQSVQGLSEEALAHDWDAFLAYNDRYAPKHKILVHIQSGFSEEMSDAANLKLIQKNARKSCPRSLKDFCKTILATKVRP